MSITSPMQAVDTSDRPFGLPADGVIVDLPFPPSTNRIWRAQRRPNGRAVTLSPEYQKWRDHADALALQRRACRDGNRVKGPFSAVILLNMDAGLGDIDNRAKAVLDWIASRGITGDDRLCMELTIRWALAEEAPDGCRVHIRGLA